MNLRPLVLTTAFVTSALVGCSRDELAPWGFAEDVRLSCTDTTTAPPRGQVGVDYTYTPTVAAGDPVSYAVDPATPLPAGLTIDPMTGTISGVPSVEGTYPLTILVTDSRDVTSMTTCGPIVIDPGAAIDCREEPGDIPDGFVDYAYAFQPTPGGGRPPYGSWTDNGTLPPGLVIDAGTGAISGVPTTVGVYNVSLSVTDADNQVITTDCGVLEIRNGVSVDTDGLLGAFPDGCVSYGVTLQQLINDGVVLPITGDSTPITCALVPGRGNGSRDFDKDANTPETFPPGIAVSADTCELSGTVDPKLRYGIYTWITTLEQSGTKAFLPYCAPQDQQTGTAYPMIREDGGVQKTLSPGHVVLGQADTMISYGTMVPDPKVTVTYNQACAGACYYAYIFSYNALSQMAGVSASPSSKFPAMGFQGFTHAIRVTEPSVDFLNIYRKRAFVTNIGFDYCIAQNEDDCGNNVADAAMKAALIRQNGGGSNYEFGLIVLPQN